MRCFAWGLAVVGGIVLLGDLWDDFLIVRMAQERGWDYFSWRMVVGHGLQYTSTQGLLER